MSFKEMMMMKRCGAFRQSDKEKAFRREHTGLGYGDGYAAGKLPQYVLKHYDEAPFAR